MFKMIRHKVIRKPAIDPPLSVQYSGPARKRFAKIESCPINSRATTLKGYVNVSDFAQIDAAYLLHPNSGNTWINGDTNYDGKIDASDYARMDAGYIASQTGGTLANDPFFARDAALVGISGADYSTLVGGQMNAAPVPVGRQTRFIGYGYVRLSGKSSSLMTQISYFPTG
jgi:hypothetical protein